MPRPARVPSTRSPELGSLTQRGSRAGTCASCGSDRVMAIAMNLTDGTPVEFVSCRRCEKRTWVQAGGEALSVDRVLDKARKTA